MHSCLVFAVHSLPSPLIHSCTHALVHARPSGSLVPGRMDFKYYVDYYGIPAELIGNNTSIQRILPTHLFKSSFQFTPLYSPPNTPLINLLFTLFNHASLSFTTGSVLESSHVVFKIEGVTSGLNVPLNLTELNSEDPIEPGSWFTTMTPKVEIDTRPLAQRRPQGASGATNTASGLSVNGVPVGTAPPTARWRIPANNNPGNVYRTDSSETNGLSSPQHTLSLIELHHNQQ